VNKPQINSLIYSRFFSFNTIFFSLLTPVRLASRRVLLLVNLSIEMVEEDNGDSRLILGLPKSLKLSFKFYVIDKSGCS
jgi:hypothetical protein